MNYVGQRSTPRKHNTDITLDEIASLYGIAIDTSQTYTKKKENERERQKEYLQLLEADEIVKDYSSSSVLLPDAETDSFLDDLFDEPSVINHDLPDWYINPAERNTNKKKHASSGTSTSTKTGSVSSSMESRFTQRKNNTMISDMFDELIDSDYDDIMQASSSKTHMKQREYREAEHAEALREATGIINGTSPIYKNNTGNMRNVADVMLKPAPIVAIKPELFDDDLDFSETSDDDFFDAMPEQENNRRIELDKQIPQINANMQSPIIASPSAPPSRNASPEWIPSLFKNDENSYVNNAKMLEAGVPRNNQKNETQVLFDRQNTASSSATGGWENFDSDNLEIDWISDEPVQGYDADGNRLEDVNMAKEEKKHGKKWIVMLLLVAVCGSGYAMYSSGMINQLIASLPFF